MAEFSSILHPTLPTLNADDAPCESQQGYHSYNRPVGQRGQPARHYPGLNPEDTVFDLQSTTITLPHSGFDRCFPLDLEQNKYPESSTYSWGGGEVGQVHSGRGAGQIPDYLYSRYDYVYSQEQDQPIASGSQPQPYYFYNGVPMSGPSPAPPLAHPQMVYQEDVVPFTTAMSSPCCTVPKSSLSPSPIKEPSLPVPPQLDPQPESPQIQCTFSYYEPPRSSEKKSAIKKKKPAMACMFCRMRKIACTPPVPGSAEVRCNQCARRSIDCQYPTESKRGQYRRLQYLERVGKEVAERIAELERQSSSGGRGRRVGRLSTTPQPY